MRKSLSTVILLLILSAFSLAWAQVAEYTFAHSTGTYQPLTTDQGTGTTGTWDDVLITPPAGSLPFTFMFNGSGYNSLVISPNGYLIMGGTSSLSYTPISSTTAAAGAIVAMTRDLQSGTDSEIRYATVGDAPNREFVVQWKNAKRYGTTGTGDNFNFQIRLSESTNQIRFVYGEMLHNATPGTYQVGLRGASNTDFTNRSSVTGWDQSVAGTTNDASMTMTDTIVPANGTIFAYSVPVASQPPNPALLVYPANNGWLFNNSIITWRSGGGLPDSYNVYFGTNSNPPFVINQTITSFSPTLEWGTTYYLKVVPQNSFGQAAGCPVWMFRTPTQTQLAESFEATTFPPAGWANPGTFTRSTTTPFHLTASAYKYSSTTAAYVLSTPKLTIEATSNLEFYAHTTTANTAQQIQIVSSPDRVTWTPVGDPIALASNGPWAPYSVSLASLAGTQPYIGFQIPIVTTAGGIYIDHVFGPEITPLTPGQVTLTLPADAAVNVLERPNFTWTANPDGGVPLGYRVYCDTNANPATLLGTSTTTSFTPTDALVYGVTYYWKVVAFNNAGDSPESAIRSFTVRPNPIVSTFPWNVDFGTTTTDPFPPVNWTKHSGILAEPTVLGAAGTGSWIQDDWTNVTTPANKAGRINIYSTLNGWLITPPINLPGTDYQLEVDIALTDYASSNPITSDPNGTTGVDDRFIILVGDGSSWSPANILREYNNSGSQYVYNEIPHTGTRLILPLAGHSGMRQIAFYGASTVSNADNDFFIDNVTVRQSPSSPLFEITPNTWNFGTVLVGNSPSRQFVFTNNGIGTLGVNNISISGSPAFTLANLPALPVNLTIGQTASFNVVYAPTSAGAHTATISITDNLGRTVNTVVVNGTGFDATITTLPLSENWDAVTVPALPLGWTELVQSTVTTAYVRTSTTSPYSTPNTVTMTNSTDANAFVALVAPPLSTQIPMNTTRLKAWLKSGAAGYTVSVGVMTNPSDPATFVEIQSITPTTAWVEYSIPFQSYTGQGRFFAIKHGLGGTSRTIYVDNVTLEMVGANDLAALSVTGSTSPSNGNATAYTVSVYNNGTATQTAYTVQLIDANNTVLASIPGTSLAAAQTATFELTWTPSQEGPMSLRGQVVLAGDVNPGNNISPALNITVMPAQTIVVTVGEGNLNEGVPWEFYYRNSLYQTLYYPDEVGFFGQIIALKFYNQFTTNLSNKPVKLWLGSTQQADLSAGWVPLTELTLVYDGTLNFPSGANDITVPLQNTFDYTSGNLVLYAQRPMDTAYFSSSDDFKAQTIGTNRSRKLQNDSTVLDPANPTGGTVSGTFPKTTFVMTPLTNEPQIAITPASVDYGTILMGASQTRQVRITNVGGGTLGINNVSIAGSPYYTIANLPTLPASLNTGQTLTLNVVYAPTAAGTHTATITIVDNIGTLRTVSLGERTAPQTRTTNVINITGIALDATITTLPYSYGFDDVTTPALPIQWSKLIQSTATALVQTYTTTPQSAPNTAGMTNSTDANATAILIAPPLATTIPANTTRVKFWARGGSTGYTLSIGVMGNPTDALTYQEIQMISLTSTWTEYVVSLTGYTGTGRFIAFKHGLGGTSRLIYIDTVSLELVAPNDLGAMSISGNNTPTSGMSTDYVVNVQNWGTNAQNNYQVKLFAQDGTELSSVNGPAINAGQTLPVTVPWVPATQGAFTIYGKVVLAGDPNPANDQTPNLNLLINPPGIMSLTIGEGGSTGRVPVDMFYKNSLYEVIFTNAELSNFIGQITGIQFYNNFNTNLPNKPTKVWLGTTTQTSLQDGWIPSTNLTQVFDGNIDYPIGQNIITIPLANPFMYLNGENLVMMVNRPMDTAYFSSSDLFVTQTSGTNRSRNIYSDSVTYDPAAPTGGTVSGIYPKTTFLIIPGGVGDISGTVTGAGSVPLADVSVVLQDAGYSTTTNAMGEYSLLNVLPGNYTMVFSKYGYVTYIQNITLAEDQELTVNATLQTWPVVNVTGTITASDTGNPINGAAISLNGYADYTASTNAQGNFTVTGVYTANTYSYRITATGYSPLTGTITIGTTNHNMGTMVLEEMAFNPGNVTAVANGADTEVTISWTAPDPNAIALDESFESTTYPPMDWTQTITNTGAPNSSGVSPTWCRFGPVTIAEATVNPTDGNFQTGLWWAYSHQDEWLITPSFYCPSNTILNFDTYVFQGSTAGDHYYVKVSIDNGNNWTILWDASAQTGGWNYYASPITIDLSSYASQTIKLAFHAIDPPSNDGLWYVWFIDDIHLSNGVTRITFNTGDLERRSASSQMSSGFSGTIPVLPSRAQQNGWVRTETSLPQADSSSDPTRVLVGYKVWRLTAGQEGNPTTWTQITPQTTSNLSAVDTSWVTAPNGTYRYAVRSIYTAEVMSGPAFSAPLNKETVTGMISGVVRRQNNTGIAGATITAGAFSATTNSAGAYTMIIPVGTYSVTASAAGFQNNTQNNIVVNANQSTTVNFIMIPGSDGEEDILPVTATALKGNYPNPFNPSTTISYSVKDAARVRIDIYNLKGQLIRTLVDDMQNTGNYNVVWNGRDESGRPVGSGVYLYRMQAGNYNSTRKMMLVE